MWNRQVTVFLLSSAITENRLLILWKILLMLLFRLIILSRIPSVMRQRIQQAEQRIVDYISQNSGITIKELVSASGYSDGYIRKILTSLKEKKIIERHGGNRYGKWIVVKR